MAEKVLQNYRIQLRDGLTGPVIKSLLDDLEADNVLGTEEIEEILQKTKTRTDQARDLIDFVRKKGRKASEILLKSLKENDKLLYESLNIDSHSATQETGATSSHIPITADKPKTTTDEYKMDSNPRGLCLIINNENFENPKMKRKGSQKDADCLKGLFEYLGFRVEIKEDQTASEIKQLMIDYSKKERLHADCFVCCVLSHGDETGVVGYDQEICPLKDITSPFDGVNCPFLIGKPKVFFIQACRGHEMQSKVLVADDSGSSRIQKSGNVSYIAKDSDFLIAMSTVQGYVSIRDTYNGSWFIQSLCKHLEEGSKRGQDILSILTKVNNDVSHKEGIIKKNNDEIDAKMTPQPLFTLTKPLFFRAP